MDIMNKKPTQKDVAKLANISQSTVSQVINNPGSVNISEKTKTRVLEAILELGYVPDKFAIGLRSGKSFCIAAVIPDIANPFYPPLLRGIQDVARIHGYDLIIYDTHRKSEYEKQALKSLSNGYVDGAIVLLFHHEDKDLIPAIDLGLSVVSIRAEKPDGNDPVDNVYVDNIKNAQLAVRHLIKKGHKRIGLLSGLESTPPNVCREKGYRLELQRNQIKIIEKYIQASDFTEDGGYEGMKKLLKVSSNLTAVVAVDDLMAIGAMKAIKESGLKIPDDISIVGFDDIPAARLVTPTLTTMNGFQENIGKRAAMMLFDRIESSKEFKKRTLELSAKLIVRDSS